MSKQRTRQVVINFPVDLLHQLDEAAAAMKLCRSHLILRSLRRDYSAILRLEAGKARQQSRDLETEFGAWK